MAADEPPYLTVGTDVSAKYKGAFCEAKIKKVNRFVKCKLTFKNNQGTAVVGDDQVRGTLRVGAHVEGKHPEKSQYLEAVIAKLLDYSQYTVVFDDGDETTLRRSSLCLKSGRHFAESESLDQLPLTNPEHFGTPVIGSKSRRKRRSAALNLSIDEDSSEDEATAKRFKETGKRKVSVPDLGKVVCFELGDKRKKDSWFPGLVVAPSAHNGFKINPKEDYLVRSFKDGKYYQVTKKETKNLTKEMSFRLDKVAVEKAHLYLEQNELPAHWDADVLMGTGGGGQSADEDSHDSDTSDDEPSEEKDRFVAQLYKFMEERGTPINKAPTVGNRDLNLYKLFKVVQKMGGYNRVTNQNQWKVVFTKMGLPNSTHASLKQLRQAHKKYLHSFEDFFRKLGCTMVTNTRSNRVRQDRNLMMTRNRDRDLNASRARLHSKEKKKEERAAAKAELEKEEEKARTPRTRTSCRDDGESSKEGASSSEDKKETRHSIKQEVVAEAEGKKVTPKRQESEDEAIGEKSRTPKQVSAEKGKKKVKESEKRDKIPAKQSSKAAALTAKEEDEKVPTTKAAVPLVEKVKKKRIKKEPLVDVESFGEGKDGSNSDDEDGKFESTDSDKRTKDSMAIRKQVKKKLKPREDDDDDDGGSRDTDDEKDSDINEQACSNIEIGDKLKVKYGRGKQLKIYEAKVIKIEENCLKPYFVHYTGWNVRYDEWIRRSRIVDNTTKSQAKKKKSALKLSAATKLAAKKSRTNSVSPTTTTHSVRKSSISSGPPNSRHTRSEKSNLFTGLEPRKRTRRKSGMGGTDLQASDNDSGELSDACDSSMDKSMDKTCESFLDRSESLRDEDEDDMLDIDEKPFVKVENETEPAIEKEPMIQIKTEFMDNGEDTREKPEMDSSTVALDLQKPDDVVASEEENLQKNVESSISEIPDLVVEESVPVRSELEGTSRVQIDDQNSLLLKEVIVSDVTKEETKNVIVDELLEDSTAENTENEDENVDSSFDKVDDTGKKELESTDNDVRDNTFVFGKIVASEDAEMAADIRISKDSDMCSFVSKLEEIEQSEDSKANIEKLINDLESPESSSDTSHTDSESDLPKLAADGSREPVKKDSESTLLSSTNTEAKSPVASISELSAESAKVVDYRKLQSDAKKEGRKKKLKPVKPEKKPAVEQLDDDLKPKPKKRQKHDDQEEEAKQHRNKKLKRNKGKKRIEPPESSSEAEKRNEKECDRVKKKDKRRKEERKPYGTESLKSAEGTKKEKRKGRKNKEKILEKKTLDFFGEKKVKKKRKGHSETTSLPDVDSDKGTETEKHPKTLKKKRGKKSKAKDDSETKTATFFAKKDKRLKLELPESLASSNDQQNENNNDLSFLLCEEKVPASPVGDTSPDNNDESSDSKPAVGGPFPESSEGGTYSGFALSCLAKTVERHEDVATVLDNTPPTTPESTDSALLGATPPHKRDNICLRGVEFEGSGDPSLGAGYLHESRKGDRLESEDTAESTLSSSHSGSDNDNDGGKSFFKRQHLENDSAKKQKKNKRGDSLYNKQKIIAKAKESKELLMKAAESSDSDGSLQRLSSSCLFTPSLMGLGQVSSVPSSVQSNRPSKFNFYVPLDDYADSDKRISVLQEKLSELRKVYMGLKAEVALIDRRRKKAKKKEKETGNSTSSSNSSHGTDQPAVHHPS